MIAVYIRKCGCKINRLARPVLTTGQAGPSALACAYGEQEGTYRRSRRSFTRKADRRSGGRSTPDNLFEPVSSNDKLEGSFSDRALPRSLYNWFELRPTVKRAAAVGAALGTLAILRAR